MKKTHVCSWIAFCRKARTKVETSSLRNFKIMPKNLNAILLSWISSLVSRRLSYSDAMNTLMSSLLKLPLPSANTGRMPLVAERKVRPRKRNGWLRSSCECWCELQFVQRQHQIVCFFKFQTASWWLHSLPLFSSFSFLFVTSFPSSLVIYFISYRLSFLVSIP